MKQDFLHTVDPAILAESMLQNAEIVKQVDNDYGKLTQFIKQGYDIIPMSALFDFMQEITKYCFEVDWSKSKFIENEMLYMVRLQDANEEL